MRHFLVCLHDASPAFESETRTMVRDLAPLLGRRFSCAVVPDWHGRWPLPAHPDYCRLVLGSSDELLLHGFVHQRKRGFGLPAFIAEGCDEMSGLDADEARRTIDRGQRLFVRAFGERARGFLAPGWQAGHVRGARASDFGLDHVLGFFSLNATSGRRVRLATWTWDCGRWAWPGHIGHGVGWLSHTVGRGVPVLAIHPRDLHRGFWPRIVRLTETLLEHGYAPTTSAALLEAGDAEVRT